MKKLILQSVDLKFEVDVVRVRQKTRQFAKALGFDSQDQVRIATAVSEIARNAYEYAGGGRVEFGITQRNPQRFQILIRDSGPGIKDLDQIFSGQYVSHTGMGVGMSGAKKLMDSMVVESQMASPTSDSGTTVILEKARPVHLPDILPTELSQIHNNSTDNLRDFPLSELQIQNRELFEALDKLKKQQDELARINDELQKANEELADTNKGVLALYTELDEQALALKRANNTKSAFLANMTHEFRSPLNTILNISNLLLDKEHGLQNQDHVTQVRFIQKSAASLSTLVNDLLDIAKVEAGKISVRVSEFTLGEIFGSLRGLMKPLLSTHQKLELIFEDYQQEALLRTDEGKLSQILKNLISNALKYTPEGEVRISSYVNDQREIVFNIRDTGIGISTEDQKKIFEEFVQIDSPYQQSHKGTGLGLPLSERLARLLGGRIEVTSEIGKGSCFSVIIPVDYRGEFEADYLNPKKPQASKAVSESSFDICIIDDNQADRYYLRSLLNQLGLHAKDFESAKVALNFMSNSTPRLVFLDLNMPEMNGYEVLKALMTNSKTKDIPVVIHSSQNLEDGDREYFNQVGADILPKNAEEATAAKLSEILKKHRLIQGSASL